MEAKVIFLKDNFFDSMSHRGKLMSLHLLFVFQRKGFCIEKKISLPQVQLENVEIKFIKWTITVLL